MRLSPTETRVANLVKQGHRIKEIALQLDISPRTVEFHRDNIGDETMSRILIVDDDFTIKLELEEMLTAIGYDIVGTAENGEQAFEMAKALNPDLILMDIVMRGDMDGISAAEKIRRESDIPIAFITGYGDPEYVERAKMVEPFSYVMKPFDEKEIRAVVEIALYKRDMELKLKKAYDRLERSNRDFKKEIAERKKAEEVLRQSKKNLENLIQGVQAGVVVHGSDMKIEAFNIAALNILGLNRDQIVGREAADPCWRFVHEDGRPMNFEEYPINIVNKSRKPLRDYCLGVIRPDRNEPLWILVNAVPQFKENGEIDQIIVTSVDISKRIQSENRYRNLFTATNDGVCLHEIIYRDDKPVDYRILDINPRYESIIGIKRDDAVGALGSELYGSGEPPYLDIFTDVAETGKPGSFETYFEPMDKYFLISVFSPGPHKFATVFQDITARKETEDELKRMQMLLNETQTLTKVGGWDYDVKTQRTRWTDEVYRIYGLSPAEHDPSDLDKDVLFISRSTKGSFLVHSGMLSSMGDPTIWSCLFFRQMEPRSGCVRLGTPKRRRARLYGFWEISWT